MPDTPTPRAGRLVVTADQILADIRAAGDQREDAQYTSWDELPLTPEHARYLERKAAITPEVAAAAGIRSARTVAELPEHAQSWGMQALPAIVFPYRSSGGTVTEQVKPDTPILYKDEPKPRKYLLASGSGSLLNAVRADPEAATLVLVEGTKQSFSVASHAPAGVAVYGIAGCRSWSDSGVPIAALRVVAGKNVVVIFDADVRDNVDVWSAGERLGGVLSDEGAKTVKYAKINASAKIGIDDLLASKDDDEHRRAYLATVIAKADAKLPPKPKGRRPEPGADDVFDGEKLLAVKAARAVDRVRPAAITDEKAISLYRDGYYNIDKTAIIAAVTALLGDSYRPGHRATIEETMLGLLTDEGRYLPTYANTPMLNVKNGMLYLPTQTLKPHDPIYLSAQQIPVAWDPDATCPAYEAWIRLCGVEDQLDDLEEAASMMLDPSRTPTKALFLFGPSRSGKSTFLRILEALAGKRNRSAVTLHQLVANRFTAAQVFGKMLNVAADLSAAHVEDISIFKLMTGEDVINADRKYGKQFDFTNRALFAFSANELPTVGEGSRAYVERIKPFEFPVSFAGREDPRIEDAVMAELPGILVRFVRAWQRRQDRGGRYLPTNPRVQREFETRSDRVRQFVTERCVIHTTTIEGRSVGHGTSLDASRGSTKKRLIEAFNDWVAASSGVSLNARRVIDRMMGVEGVCEVRLLPMKARGLNVTVRDDGAEIWPDDEPDARENFSGGSFEAPSGSLGDPKLPLLREESSQVSDVSVSQVAEVANSSPIVTFSDPTCENFITESEGVEGAKEGSGGCFASQVVTMGLQIATSATWQDPFPGEVPPEPSPILTDVDVQGLLTITDRDTWAQDGAEQPSLFAPEPAAYERLTPADFTGPATETLPEGIVTFDIEGASVERVFTAGPAFAKIFGYQSERTLKVTEDAREMLDLIRRAKTVVGHNIMSFDLMYFVINHELDIHAMAAEGRLYDTQLAEVLLNPPPYYMAPARVPSQYKLDKLGLDKFGVGKQGDLGALVKRHGGDPKIDFDKIPNDDADYVTYCAADVDLTTRLARSQRRTPTQADYLTREHRIAALAAQTTINGVKVDRELLNERYATGQARKAELRQKLIDVYGLPTTKKDGKPAKSMTDEGRAAIERAFNDLGIALPRSASGKGPATGKIVMEELHEAHEGRPDVLELIETVQGFNGVRTVYQSALAALHPDGRVHPTVNMYQATGRWSVSNPGMTVFGKRAGRHVEREIFIADEGEVMISADLSQVDARAIAAWSQDPNYLLMFAPGMDLHAEVAARMFGDRGRREDAKALSHGYNYGLGFTKLAAAHGDDLARTFLDTMRNQFPRLVAWKDEIRRESEDAGFVLDNGWGRTLVINPQSNYTQAPAYVGQSAARDIMMEGLLRLPRWVLPMLRVQVHDEIVLSVPEDRVDEIKAVVADALSFPWRPFTGARGHAQSVEIIGEAGKAAKSWGGVYAK